jgi:AN1-like Zinc finger
MLIFFIGRSIFHPMPDCPFPNCKAKTTLISTPCKVCNITYCMTHRFPEIHNQVCAVNLKTQAQKDYKTETQRMKVLQKKSGKCAVSASDVAKEQVDAKKRLQDSINKKKDDRSLKSKPKK